jgi:hypothetical protein
MPNKTLPTTGSTNWGETLNNFLTQSLDNTNGGGINKFDIFSLRPTTLGADDKGKTYLYTQTGNIHQWTGTEWRILNESVINVKDYGAVGDGVADDSVFIDLAVDVAVLRQGGTIYFPKGTYLIVDRTIRFANNTQYLGSGRESTIIKIGEYKKGGFGRYLYDGMPYIFYNMRIADLTIDGNYDVLPDPNNDNLQIGIYAWHVHNSVFENILFKNILYVGVEIFSTSHNNVVQNCIFKNVGDKHTLVGPNGYYYAIGADNHCLNTKILNNVFLNCGTCINMYGNMLKLPPGADQATWEAENKNNVDINNTIISNNIISGTKSTAINGRNGVKNLIISNNVFENIGGQFVDIYIQEIDNLILNGHSNSIKIDNNIMKSYKINAFYDNFNIWAITVTGESDFYITNNLIIDTLGKSKTGGIHLSGGAGASTLGFCKVSNNSIKGKFKDYQAVRVGMNYTICENNQIDGQNEAEGFFIGSTVTNTRLVSNYFKNCITNVNDGSTGTYIFGQ